MATEYTSDDLEDALLNDAVEGIAETTVDGTNVRAIPLKERQAVLDRRQNDAAGELSNFGMRNRRLISPPGGF